MVWIRTLIKTWKMVNNSLLGHLSQQKLTEVFMWISNHIHYFLWDVMLTHWGWVTHKCIGNLTIIGPDNGLSPGRHQAILWTNAGILLIGPCGTNFSEILIGIHTFSFKKIHLKISSAKWRPLCLGLNVLINISVVRPVPSHYLNQCWNIANWTLRIKFQWNFNQNSNI